MKRMIHYPAVLEIKALRIAVHLGVGEAERANLQNIEVSVRFFFKKLPAVCGDESQTFICYDTLCTALQKKATEQPHKLIEFLCKQLHDTAHLVMRDAIGSETAKQVFVELSVTKCNPPINGLQGGSHFTISDVGGCSGNCNCTSDGCQSCKCGTSKTNACENPSCTCNPCKCTSCCCA